MTEDVCDEDLAPDADEPGDDLPEEMEEIVTDDTSVVVPDNVDMEG